MHFEIMLHRIMNHDNLPISGLNQLKFQITLILQNLKPFTIAFGVFCLNCCYFTVALLSVFVVLAFGQQGVKSQGQRTAAGFS